MEEYNLEKYKYLENVENLFKSINCYGDKYNYCFECLVRQSILPMMFGAVGGVLEAVKRKNIIGYFLNKSEKGICLMPMILGNNKTLQIDIDNYIFINENEIKKIKIKNEDIVYKAITIILNNHTKYNLKTTKEPKNINWHKENLDKFIELYK